MKSGTWKSERRGGRVDVRGSLVEWVTVATMLLFAIVLEGQEPVARYIAEGEKWMYSYPRRPDTIPSWVPLLSSCVAVPAMVAMTVWLSGSSADPDVEEMNQALLGCFMAVSCNGLVTNMAKLALGRPRPCYLARCYPGVDVTEVNLGLDCTGDTEAVVEGRKSFPSGHTSWSCSSLGYLTLMLMAKLRVFSPPGRPTSLAASLLPLLLGAYIGLTRVVDHMHHPTDVLAGAVLGCTIAWLSFRQHYPSPMDLEPHLPTFKRSPSRQLLPA